jgi:hypothetical protein
MNHCGSPGQIAAMTSEQVPPDEPQTWGERGRPHGRASSWMLVAVVLCASVAAGVALIIHVWPLFWACVAVAGASIPAGKIIGIMDDTMMWGRAPPIEQQSPGGGVVPARSRGRAGAGGSLPGGSREDPAGRDLSRGRGGACAGECGLGTRPAPGEARLPVEEAGRYRIRLSRVCTSAVSRLVLRLARLARDSFPGVTRQARQGSVRVRTAGAAGGQPVPATGPGRLARCGVGIRPAWRC